MSSVRIGAAARTLGLTPDTLRYYERIGLLPDLARDAAGRRLFGARDLSRLRFIRRAQAMDFSLSEIAQLLRLRDGTSTDRGQTRALARRKLDRIAHRLEQLRLLHDELQLLIHLCEGSDGDTCPIVEGISQHG